MSLLHLRHVAEYAVVRVSFALIQAVSIETCQTVCRVLAWLASDVLQVRAKIVEENLTHAFPDATPTERRRLARRMWEHLLLMVCEIAHAPRKIHETNWRTFVAVHRKRNLILAFLSPRPKVVVTAHFGNFEVGGYIMGFWGFPTFTMARPLDNPYLDQFVNRFRESLGQTIIPKHGTAELADSLLGTGGTLVLVGDQHAGDKGVWIEFFGRPASCHKALALFTLLNKAPMLVSGIRRLDKPMRFEVRLADLYDPAQPGNEELGGVTELTQWYNDVLEDEIRLAPDQYWWLHQRWRDPPPGRKRKRRKRRGQPVSPAMPGAQRPAA
jgi:Kdo2-lipid IVA lauroyltransferase/acyltransferase